MSYVIAALGLIVAAQTAAVVSLARARRTARRRAEEQARRQAEAGAVAHDLNNVLAVIINYASFVLDYLGDDDRRRADVDEIRRAAKQAGVLTHALMGGRQGPQNAPPRMRHAGRKRRALA
jgi:two-component system, cell cycle sensor histidine kinase and response regulator CckA